MKGFKFLGIIPFNDCNTKFSKNLKRGLAYTFFNNITVHLDQEKNKIVNVKSEYEDSNLFNLSNGINVEISAIVGLNGSGKSALTELMYYIIYALSVNSKSENRKLINLPSDNIAQKIKLVNQEAQKLNNEKTNSLELFKILEKLEITLEQKDFKEITSSKTLLKNVLFKKNELYYRAKNTFEASEKKINDELQAAILFEINKEIFSVGFSNGDIIYQKFDRFSGNHEDLNNFNFESFFYSISLNFSHHSLNSLNIGSWINSLFHKNDGYSTPVVINPMRIDGNYNINRELHLSNERLFSNVIFEMVKDEKATILNKYEIQKFIFKPKSGFDLLCCTNHIDPWFDHKKPFSKSYTPEEFNKLKSVQLVRSILGRNFLETYTPFQDYALGYIEFKIDKIKENYYWLFNDKNNKHNNAKFMSFLRTNNSHITKKLRQTINFLKHTQIENSVWVNEQSNYAFVELSKKQMLSWVKKLSNNVINLSPYELIEHALPGFLNIDYRLTLNNSEPIKLSQLSSGEQQLIFNINTITYHLYNLQSTHFHSNIEVDQLKYKNVCILLDEIEIYYHPEMQRQLTFNLLNNLERIKKVNEIGIESIHIIFMTHSPFVLSDIPSSNILRLVEGKPEPEKNQTFGANIHDLLANEFFLKDGFMGEFAKEKITQIIHELQLKIKLNDYHSLMSKKRNETNVNRFKGLEEEIKKLLDEAQEKCELLNKKIINEIENSSSVSSEIEKFIDIVGEPLIKQSLQELFVNAFPKSKDEYIDREILRLNNLKNNKR